MTTDKQAAIAAIGAFVDDYVESYVLDGDECYHEPTEHERFLIEDAINGLVADEGFVSLMTAAVAAERDALRAEVERLRAACSRENDTISQVLGRALGYPRFADDQNNFPGATDADGVCVGDHVAASLADEAANVIRALRSEVERLRTTIEHVAAIVHCGGWVGLSEDQTIVYVRVLTVGSMPRGTLNASVAALKEAVNAARAAQEGE